MTYLKNTLEGMDINPVKLHAVPQHLRLAEGKQKLEKTLETRKNVLEEKRTKLKSYVTDTLCNK